MRLDFGLLRLGYRLVLGSRRGEYFGCCSADS